MSRQQAQRQCSECGTRRTHERHYSAEVESGWVWTCCVCDTQREIKERTPREITPIEEREIEFTRATSDLAAELAAEAGCTPSQERAIAWILREINGYFAPDATVATITIEPLYRGSISVLVADAVREEHRASPNRWLIASRWHLFVGTRGTVRTGTSRLTGRRALHAAHDYFGRTR